MAVSFVYTQLPRHWIKPGIYMRYRYDDRPYGLTERWMVDGVAMGNESVPATERFYIM